MNSESTSPAGGAIDPTAIALIGTYVIDLTATTHSDIAVPDASQPIVSSAERTGASRFFRHR